MNIKPARDFYDGGWDDVVAKLAELASTDCSPETKAMLESIIDDVWSIKSATESAMDSLEDCIEGG